MPHHFAFAIPGDLSAPTGGYHYDRSLTDALRTAGGNAYHVPLPGGFPFPDAREMRIAAEALSAVPANHVLIVDGLAFGALETAMLDGLKAPVVALVHHPLAHESGSPDAEIRRLYELERSNLTKAAHVIVPSPHIRNVLVTDYDVEPTRITAIRPGRPDYKFPTERRPRDGSPLILSVGLLHPRKGHDVLIAALARLAALPWHAVIVGAPWEAGHDATLRDRVQKSGLGERIRLAGRVGSEELATLYRQAHVFALATRYEGYGIVFDEALIHGLPIVSTTAGAVPGTVPEEAGILVPSDDADAFAEALRVLLEDSTAHAAKARAARRAGADLPTWDDAAAVVARIADSLATDRT